MKAVSLSALDQVIVPHLGYRVVLAVLVVDLKTTTGDAIRTRDHVGFAVLGQMESNGVGVVPARAMQPTRTKLLILIQTSELACCDREGAASLCPRIQNCTIVCFHFHRIYPADGANDVGEWHNFSRGVGSLDKIGFMADVTQILSAIEAGDPQAAADLLPLVYEELRQLAAARLANEKPGQTLQATALVHEAYLRLVNVEAAQAWNGRAHFFAAAAEAMRRILVESARRKNRLKHGRERQRMDLESDCMVTEAPSLDLLALDEGLTRLAEFEPAKAELVKLRFFAGLTMPEAAATLEISLATAERYWTFAKSWLYAELADDL